MTENKVMDDWNKYFDELEKFFLCVPDDPVQLDAMTLIKNPRLFIDSHLSIARAHNGNRWFEPYMKRLYILKRIYGNEKKLFKKSDEKDFGRDA